LSDTVPWSPLTLNKYNKWQKALYLKSLSVFFPSRCASIANTLYYPAPHIGRVPFTEGKWAPTASIRSTDSSFGERRLSCRAMPGVEFGAVRREAGRKRLDLPIDPFVEVRKFR
jgi:hypothetical protein